MKEGVTVEELENCLYDKALKEWIEYPEQVYLELRRYQQKIYRRQKRRECCFCPKKKLWLCDGNCSECEFYFNNVVPLSTPLPKVKEKLTYEELVKDPCDVESFCLNKEYYREALNRLEKIMPGLQKVGLLRLNEMDDEEIAKELGVSRKTIYNRIHKAKTVLKREFPEFFEK